MQERQNLNRTLKAIHCMIDLYECNRVRLDDEDFVQKTIMKAIEISGSTLLKYTYHKFEPQGLTAIALISESHMSIHTWPENGYAAIDLFTCRQEPSLTKVYEYLVDRFEAGTHEIKYIERGKGRPGSQPGRNPGFQPGIDEDI